MRVGVFKRSQGRIVRQVTFAALTVAIALGTFRLSGMLVWLDPSVHAEPAKIGCMTKTSSADADAKVTVTGTAGSAVIDVRKGEELIKVAGTIDAARKKTGVAASMNDAGVMVLTSLANGSESFVKIDAPADVWKTAGVGTVLDIGRDGAVHGRDEVNIGLHYLIPGLILALGAWFSYRLVNVPAFADFLIAVEAEMNKVSWPSRGELTRASMVVLILIVALAFVLFGFDVTWHWLFQRLGIT
jgi:preprotein translocase SecE subunit